MEQPWLSSDCIKKGDGKMRTTLRKIIFAALILITLLAVPCYCQQKNIEGILVGTLDVSVAKLRVVFKISKNEDGSLNATMDSPDQGAEGIPVSKVSFENPKLMIEVNSIKGSFEGTLKGDSFEGQWKQGGMTFPLVLKHSEEIPKRNRPQEPKKPYPYIEEEVLIENAQAGVKLAGTLTISRSDKPCAAVILISGSGAQDRNEAVFGHKPFLVLADYLTRKGIAVLRVDDRGIGGSTGNAANSTSEDFAGDVIAEVNFLKSRREIDSNKIGLIGHSEGGIIAPMVAAQVPDDIGFIVLLAGTGVTGKKILYYQNDLAQKRIGASEEKQKIQRQTLEIIFTIIKTEKDEKNIEEKVREVLTSTVEKLSQKEKDELGDIEIFFQTQLAIIKNPWMRFFVSYDPKPALRKVKCSVLALNGQLDKQVEPKQNLSAIEDALKAGGNKDYTIKELPGLNHLFQHAETGDVSEYAEIEETISTEVLEIISKWILERTE
ncbi:MAG: alpha/beta fold hydrolase [Sedimentisphaerales bacterium]|nr:alpha/beta fold hydrolase [Sedimentisphaerales bacterium]